MQHAWRSPKPPHLKFNQDSSKWNFSAHGAICTAISLCRRRFPCLHGAFPVYIALERAAVTIDVSSAN